MREQPDEFRRVIDINLNGTYWAAQACGKRMNPGSSIVNIASFLGLIKSYAPQASGGCNLLGVHLPHPPLTDESVYTEFFGAPVRFGADDALLRVRTKLFSQPMSTPVNPVLRHMAVEYLVSCAVNTMNNRRLDGWRVGAGR